MPLHLFADAQQAPVVETCARCGGEIYHEEDGRICPDCRKELDRWDQKTARAILEDMDFELQKVLSDDMRNTIWNAIAPKYLADEA